MRFLTCIRHKNFGSCSVGSGATQNVPESPATRTSSKTVPCYDGWLAKTGSGQTVGQAFGPQRDDHKEATTKRRPNEEAFLSRTHQLHHPVDALCRRAVEQQWREHGRCPAWVKRAIVSASTGATTQESQ